MPNATRIRNPKPHYITIPIDLGPVLTAKVGRYARQHHMSVERAIERLVTQRLTLGSAT